MISDTSLFFFQLIDSHMATGLQGAAANRFDEVFTTKYNETANEITG